MDSKKEIKLEDLGTNWIGRFWDKVNKGDSDECWQWQACTRVGYGALNVNGKLYGAHRLSFLLEEGVIPEKSQICHHCDNRSCVNPNHLFLGDSSKNMKDAYKKGKLTHIDKADPNYAKGEDNNSKLSKSKAKEIKHLKNNSDLTVREIADDFNVSHSVVVDIGNGNLWSHI